MSTFRSFVLAPIAVALVAALAGSAAVSLAGTAAQPVPTAKLTAKLSPHGRRPGTPVALTLDTRFASDPPGTGFVLRRPSYTLPRGTIVNGRLFPACSVRTLRRTHGTLRACPKGSKIGQGVIVGRAVDIGVISRARVTLFNGPGGRTVAMNVAVKMPAMVNAQVSAPLRRLARRDADELTFATPAVLRRILDGDITTLRIHLTIGATRSVRGVRRGYLEVRRCPRSGRTRMQGRFAFERGRTASAGANLAC
jgi:hypothetical protein